jgi:hypothetical protein
MVSIRTKTFITLLNRKLSSDGKVAVKARGEYRSSEGKYYLLDVFTGQIQYLSLAELESLARTLHVLKEQENVKL